MITRILAFFTALILSSAAQATIFRNAYVSFELPDKWKCNLEQTEWVCRSEDGQKAREAIIILTAKEVGPMDSFEAYLNHLNTPQQVTYKSVGTTTSKITYPPKRVTINDQLWIDGLHQGSEVPSYFTRYLATIKGKIAVLVTFSAHRNKYTEYSPAFFKAVNSLRVIATANLAASPDMGPVRPSTESLGAPISGAMPGDLEGDEGGMAVGGAGRGGSSTKTLLLVFALIVGAAGIYLYLKNQR